MSLVSAERAHAVLRNTWGLISSAWLQCRDFCSCCVCEEAGTNSDDTFHPFPIVARYYQLCPDVKCSTRLICFMFADGLSCQYWLCGIRIYRVAQPVCVGSGCYSSSQGDFLHIPIKAIFPLLSTLRSVGPALMLAKQPHQSNIRCLLPQHM